MRHLISVCVSVALVAACGRGNGPESAEHEPPTLAVTSWTAASELFMEHPPLVAGDTVRFAVHLTRLADFSALNAGRPSIELTPISGGPSTTLPGTDPLRPGAFRVEGPLPSAGEYRWALVVEAPDLSDRHDLGTTTVYADAAAAAPRPRASPRGMPPASAISRSSSGTTPLPPRQSRRRRCAPPSACLARSNRWLAAKP